MAHRGSGPRDQENEGPREAEEVDAEDDDQVDDVNDADDDAQVEAAFSRRNVAAAQRARPKTASLNKPAHLAEPHQSAPSQNATGVAASSANVPTQRPKSAFGDSRTRGLRLRQPGRLSADHIESLTEMLRDAVERAADPSARFASRTAALSAAGAIPAPPPFASSRPVSAVTHVPLAARPFSASSSSAHGGALRRGGAQPSTDPQRAKADDGEALYVAGGGIAAVRAGRPTTAPRRSRPGSAVSARPSSAKATAARPVSASTRLSASSSRPASAAAGGGAPPAQSLISSSVKTLAELTGPSDAYLDLEQRYLSHLEHMKLQTLRRDKATSRSVYDAYADIREAATTQPADGGAAYEAAPAPHGLTATGRPPTGAASRPTTAAKSRSATASSQRSAKHSWLDPAPATTPDDAAAGHGTLGIAQAIQVRRHDEQRYLQSARSAATVGSPQGSPRHFDAASSSPIAAGQSSVAHRPTAVYGAVPGLAATRRAQDAAATASATGGGSPAAHSAAIGRFFFDDHRHHSITAYLTELKTQRLAPFRMGARRSEQRQTADRRAGQRIESDADAAVEYIQRYVASLGPLLPTRGTVGDIDE
jgi:hypothetical protein